MVTVSSYELDRKTGAVKKACKAGPVFITKRKQVTHVLLTVEDFERSYLVEEASLQR